MILFLMILLNGAGGRKSDSVCLIGIHLLFALIAGIELVRYFIRTKRARVFN